MVDSIAQMASLMGVSTAVATTILTLLSAWEVIWTGLGMWKSAKRNQTVWFVVFLIVNLLGIPEIIYLIVTRKKSVGKKIKKKKR